MVVALAILLVLSAVVTVQAKDLVVAVIGGAVFSLALATLFFMMHALEVAIAEAVVGAAISTLLLLFAISRTRRYEESDQ